MSRHQPATNWPSSRSLPPIGRVVGVVAGGTGGIGGEIVRRLLGSGASVAALSRGGSEISGTTGHEVMQISCDVTSVDDLRNAAKEVASQFGGPNVLVHAAGGRSPGGLFDLTPHDWSQALEIHLSSAFHLCQAFVPHMISAGGGSILLVGSAAGSRAVVDSLAYATAKSALPHFVRCLARELAPYKVRINCLAPGFVDTQFHVGMADADQTVVNDRVPLGRFATASEVADLALALIDNAYLTGETIRLDGGLNLT